MQLVVILAALALAWLLRSRAGGASGAPALPLQPSASSDQFGPIDDLTQGWAQFEGWLQPGTVAQRSNNPINIKGTWPGVVGHTPSGIAVFDDEGDAWDAADSWLTTQATQHPDWTLRQLFAKVLGSLSGESVNNAQGDSNAEADYVANYLGVSPDANLANFLGTGTG